MSAALSSFLDLPRDAVEALAAAVLAPRTDAPLAGRVVAVLDQGPTCLPPAAWVAGATRLGAGVIRSADLGGVESDDAFAAALEAARWADVLVTSHPDRGFAHAVGVSTSRPVIDAGERGGEDLAAGLSLLAAARATRPKRRRRPLHAAVCGDLRESRSARGLLSALAAVGATQLLVPARGRDLPHDELDRLARRTGRQALRFEARSMRSLLDMVDTVLISPETAAQLPLFREVGVPPGEAERRVRREVEDTDVLFVAAGNGAADRLVAEPFRTRRVGVPAGQEHRTGRAAVEALLWMTTEGFPARPSAAIYASELGLTCRSAHCFAARDPGRAPPNFELLDGGPDELACSYCAARTTAAFAASAEKGRFHAVGSADAARVLPRNLVLFRSRGEALEAGFVASRRGGG